MVTVRKDKLTNDALGTGRRKSSVARVRIRPGQGNIKINNRALESYFPNEQDRRALLEPLEESGKRGEVDVIIRVHGGGSTGQSGACRMGIARALVSYDTEVGTTAVSPRRKVVVMFAMALSLSADDKHVSTGI